MFSIEYYIQKTRAFPLIDAALDFLVLLLSCQFNIKNVYVVTFSKIRLIW